MEPDETVRISLAGTLARDPIYTDEPERGARLDIAVVRADGNDVWTVHAHGTRLVGYLKAHQARQGDFICALGTAEQTDTDLDIDADILCLDTSATWSEE
jgi:hypothetical protein